MQENGQVRSPRHGKEKIWDIKVRKKEKKKAGGNQGGLGGERYSTHNLPLLRLFLWLILRAHNGQELTFCTPVHFFRIL